MSLRLTRARFLRAAAASATVVPLSAQARGEELLEVTDSETATIDGRDWDTPIVGGRTVDAVHRSVLLSTFDFHFAKGEVTSSTTCGLLSPGFISSRQS